ncbi:hypothetical protein, partial [Acinetobacter baumannii]|uniref:hypothetical protein n=1 Tax=Acinetobacter baumannii TaxID=470 RepID=UPI001BB2DE0A
LLIIMVAKRKRVSRLIPKCTKNTFFGVTPLVPLMEEREWDTLGCAGFLGISLLTLFRFATIIMSNEWA